MYKITAGSAVPYGTEISVTMTKHAIRL